MDATSWTWEDVILLPIREQVFRESWPTASRSQFGRNEDEWSSASEVKMHRHLILGTPVVNLSVYVGP